MYSKDVASQLRQEFWTVFGRYISPQLSADGFKINWVNYKTGLKQVYFRMEADKQTAIIAIEITHADAGIRELFFEQFKELRNTLASTTGEQWHWELHYPNEHGKIISRIYQQLNSVSIYNRNDWPALISFFKPRIIALDEFWDTAKYSFEGFK